ncbi:MAG: hypothetical protein H6760_05255 [Candidatus Nomurabacteria bacterium]|nr:MAG: hypothetical protein H6760_05255 [Candidatus Nomurabacteria bacterium]
MINKGITWLPILFIFAALGVGSFIVYIGWQVATQTQEVANVNNDVACTLEAKLCPDGSYVGRTGLNCEFAECSEEVTCGTIAGLECPSGYKCEYDNPEIADAAGTCVLDTETSTEEDYSNWSRSMNWREYSYRYTTKEFIHTTQDAGEEIITTPFNASEYTGTVTWNGALFWRTGPSATTYIPDISSDFEYEAGVDPDFWFYDYASEQFIHLPKVDYLDGTELFESTVQVFPSLNEPKLLLEVGKFDIQSEEFIPGFSSPMPVSTRGLVYNFAKNTFEDAVDPIDSFNQVMKSKGTAYTSIVWNSEKEIIIAAPGGEGCGNYSYVNLIDYQSLSKEVVGGEASYNYSETPCNPKSGMSPDGKWFVLYGSTTDDTFVVRLYASDGTTSPVATLIGDVLPQYSSLSEWDVSREYPVLTFNEGSTANFITAEFKAVIQEDNEGEVQKNSYTDQIFGFTFKYPIRYHVNRAANNNEDLVLQVFESSDADNSVFSLYHSDDTEKYEGEYRSDGFENFVLVSNDAQIGDEIIESFNFVDTWRTYQNETYSYTIRYPQTYSIGGPPADMPHDDWKSIRRNDISEQYNVEVRIFDRDEFVDDNIFNWVVNGFPGDVPAEGYNPEGYLNKRTVDIDGKKFTVFDYSYDGVEFFQYFFYWEEQKRVIQLFDSHPVGSVSKINQAIIQSLDFTGF